MVKQTVKLVFLISALLAFVISCGEQKIETQVELHVSLDGEPVNQAKVMIDGADVGSTDANGYFMRSIGRKANSKVNVSVATELPGHLIEPWEDSFLVKRPEEKGAVGKQLFTVKLKSTKYITFITTEKDDPIRDAAIEVNGKSVGNTDDNGKFVYEYRTLPQESMTIAVSKENYSRWEKTITVKAGQKIEIPLSRQYITLVVTEKGNPLEDAAIKIDGNIVGNTDEKGEYIYEYSTVSEKGLTILVAKKGYAKWKKKIKVKPLQKVSISLYPKSITFLVKVRGKPLSGAVVRVEEKRVGKTNKKGKFTYKYNAYPKKPLTLKVSKKGYSYWMKRVRVRPPQEFRVSLHEAAYVTINTFTEDYGLSRGIPGVKVIINDKQVGETNEAGVYTYVYAGKPLEEVPLKLSATGYSPAEWETTIALKGKKSIQRYFYSNALQPIRVGVYGYVSNSPDEDMQGVLERIEQAVSNNIFSYLCFNEVSKEKLHNRIILTGRNIEELTNDGWQRTTLIRAVDMIILGSVAKEGTKYTFETKVYASDGRLLLSQLNRDIRKKHIKRTARHIAEKIIERFPFEGTVVSVQGDRYEINLGKYDYKLRRGMEFDVMAANLEETGKLESYRTIGRLIVKKVETTGSWAEIDEIDEGQKLDIGHKVVRRIYRESEIKDAKESFILIASGGLPPDTTPMGGVNIYIDDLWVGITGPDGKKEIPVRVGKKYDLVLYRHGYQQVKEEIEVDQDRETRKFTLTVNNSLFKVESHPSQAKTYIDDEKIGITPILDGHNVTFGFHKVMLSVGGDYRDYEKVVEFNEKVEDRTGKNKIVLVKDYLKIGLRAEEKGDYHAAMKAYSSSNKEHPDYSHTRNRLAQIYMDEKEDYDSAIRELENVLTLPENKQLIYKQFAVSFINLGHAYYEKGNSLIRKDRKEAARNFAKSIQNLKTAKQNTRFFPSKHYDKALHDTHYYLALSYLKLYLITKKNIFLDKADLAWREYFDFFPKSLESSNTFVKIRESAEKYWAQIKDLQ